MTQNDEIEIDLLKLIKALWKKAWAIVLVAVIFGGAMFAYGKATYDYVPEYTAETILYTSYANSREFSYADNSGNISQNSLGEARSMVNTCITVLKTRMTMEAVIAEAGLDMDYEELSGMISAASLNNTELFAVTVTGNDAEEAARIANTVAQVLPEKVAMVNSNSFVGVIDEALVPGTANPHSDDTVKNAVMAAVLGAFLVCGVVAVKEVANQWKSASALNAKKEEK